nr:type I polyketide synthase [uncultured Caldimonas sp.]
MRASYETASSLLEPLLAQTNENANHPAIVFLADGETESERVTYAELHRRAGVIAARLRSEGMERQHVLLMLGSGIHYVVAFLGCMYAGAVPVPVYAPSNSRHASRILHILEDCDAKVALVSASAEDAIRERLSLSSQNDRKCTLIAVEDACREATVPEWPEPRLERRSTAYLQYTSGSTREPRGVAVTHANLLSYCEGWRQSAAGSRGDVFVTWLPLFHDMGLILGVLQALYLGATMVMMPPVAFLQKPLRWLAAISRYRGTVSYAPNFAYELCATASDQTLIDSLDLASWAVAGNAAEAVHADTLSRFASRFGHVGFRADAMNPSYGLAEATLTVTSHARLQPPPRIDVDALALRNGTVQLPAFGACTRSLVSCGRTWHDMELSIVDPTSHIECADGCVGEVWLRGSLVANGYWQQPHVSGPVFEAVLADGRGPYLRTGDLGVLVDGYLYITGRIKDLVIVRGQNHAPQDIEHTVYRSHKALQVGRGAAFSVPVNHEEGLVVVQEVRRSHRQTFDGGQIVQAIRAAVARDHGLAVHAIRLLRPGTVHITSSGKIQRQECRHGFLNGSLETLYEWEEPVLSPSPAGGNECVERRKERDSVVEWLKERVAALRGCASGDVDSGASFSALGLDSLKLVALSGELARRTGTRIEPIALYNHPTIDALARHATTAAATAVSASERPAAEPMAVIGIACRFPKADSAEDYWHLLDTGVDAITEVPVSRWNAEAFFQPGESAPGKTYAKWGGFLADIDGFDANFFDISPREAAGMDPQQRLLLQTVWHALEDSGIPAASLAGSDAGVFIGAMTHDYELLGQSQHVPMDAHFGTGTQASILANRISYWLDLRGPSWVAQTACSSSLVALHSARLSLQARECDVALVGGVNCLLGPELFVALSQAQMLSPDGRCMSFDARANGYVRSEGCAVLVLKRYSDAVREGDNIHGVIRGTAVNQDGRSNGITAPNGEAQRAVIRRALAVAGVQAAEVGYVEAHGTGTSLGDPVEADALKCTYGVSSQTQPTLWLGSAKTHIGHTEPVSGLAGLIKVLLSMRHERLPANLHFEGLNPHISLEGTRCAVLSRPQVWRRGPAPRIAGVSSFGFGGTNAHVIVSEAPQTYRAARSHTCEGDMHLLALSARTPTALTRRARDIADFLEGVGAAASGISLDDVCHTANTLRDHMACRFAVVGRTTSEMSAALRHRAVVQEQRSASRVSSMAASNARVALLFTGQGSQYLGMGQELYRSHGLYRDVLNRCDQVLRPLLQGRSLVKGLYGDAADRFDLRQTQYAQPALFCVEYALAQIWQAAGLRPHCLLGHSLGEYVAACVAGVFGLEDALKLVAHRGRLMQRSRPGTMVAVDGDAATLAALVDELVAEVPADVALAARNSVSEVVISGSSDSVSAWLARWRARAPEGALHVRALPVDRAFHSPLMADMLDEFEAVARAVVYRRPALSVISNITGGPVSDELTDARYWVEHVCRPVEFDRGMQTVVNEGCRLFVEVGPHPVLATYGGQTVGDGMWLPSLRRGGDAEEQLLNSVGEWYEQGGRVDWQGLARARTGASSMLHRAVRLPPYPFELERHWFLPGTPASHEPSVHPLLGQRLSLSGGEESGFRARLASGRLWFVDEHRTFGIALMPLAAVVEAALAAVRHSTPEPLPEWTLQELALKSPMTLQGDQPVELECRVRPLQSASGHDVVLQARFRARDTAEAPGWSGWREQASSRVLPSCFPRPEKLDTLALQRDAASLRERSADELYARAASLGLEYGSGLRGIRRLWVGARAAIARVEMPTRATEDTAYHLHPATLDACFHVAIPFIEEALAGRPAGLLPTALDQLTVWQRLPSSVWTLCTWHGEVDEGRYLADLDIHADDGRCVVSMRGLRLALAGRSSLTRQEPREELRHHKLCWVPWEADGHGDEVFADAARPWVIACPDRDEALRLGRAARVAGAGAIVVSDGSEFAHRPDSSFELCWHDPLQWKKLFDVLRVNGVRPAGLIYDGGHRVVTPRALSDEIACRGKAALRACQQFLLDFSEKDIAVVVCTRGASVPSQAVQDGYRLDEPGLAQCVETAMAKAIASEFSHVRALQVDLDPDEAADDVSLGLMFEAARNLRGSAQLAIRAGRCFEAQLMEVPGSQLLAREVSFKGDATYLVTGGTRGIGLATVEWLVARGARSVAVVGRHRNGASDAVLRQLQARGASVRLFLADVSDREALSSVLEQIRDSMAPLRGIFHCAGITDDAALSLMDWPRVRDVLAPKALGAWHLHELTVDHELDHFVLYSSLASLAASPGQLNHIAACSFLDALALYRRHRGLAGLSINWGYWSEIGVGARRDLSARMASLGVGGIETQQGLDALHRLVGSQLVQCGAVIVDWTKFKRALFPSAPFRPLLTLGDDTRAHRPVGEETAAVRLEPAMAELPAEEAKAKILASLLSLVTSTLKLGSQAQTQLAQDFARTPLNRLGLDSLMALEMRNRIRGDAGVVVPVKHFLGDSTAEEVADLIFTEWILQRLVHPCGGSASEEVESFTL